MEHALGRMSNDQFSMKSKEKESISLAKEIISKFESCHRQIMPQADRRSKMRLCSMRLCSMRLGSMRCGALRKANHKKQLKIVSKKCLAGQAGNDYDACTALRSATGQEILITLAFCQAGE
jgi:hypothetical protein